MARHIHLDAVGGVAGDMFVAALLDALPELRRRVLADAAAVLPEGAPALADRPSAGIRALGFGLTGLHGHGHDHGYGHHHHGHGGEAGDFRDMVQRIRGAALHDGTGEQAVAILTILAEAEAAIHGVPVASVHFHEIADWDSLLDVVAAGSIAAALPDVRWSVSPLPLGGGLVKTRHGLLPVPAPATAAILKGFAWRDDGVGGERVTPTGAAILRHLVAEAGGPPAGGRLGAVGVGAGTRALPGMANILRALVFSEEAAAAGAAEEVVTVLEFDIDDMTGEEIAVAAECLRGVAGVLDLSIGQRQGKKGRAMQSFRLLVGPGAVEAVAARCFTETSTIGLRLHDERRIVLPREQVQATGGVGVKLVRRPGGTASAKAESDHVAAADGLEARRRARRRAECEAQP